MKSTNNVSHYHYIPLALDKVIKILGWTLETTTEDTDTFYTPIDRQGLRHSAIKLDYNEPGTLICIYPGYAHSQGTKQITKTFGCTKLAKHQFERFATILRDNNMLAERTILVEAQPGDEIWGELVHGGNYMRITRADGLVIDTIYLGRDREFHGDRVVLTAKTYSTVSDSASDVHMDAYDDLIMEPTDMMPGLLASVLADYAIGRVHVFGVIDGPLNASQSVCWGDDGRKCYHEAPEGFIGQFTPPFPQASHNFIVSQTNGAIKVEMHAL